MPYIEDKKVKIIKFTKYLVFIKNIKFGNILIIK